MSLDNAPAVAGIKRAYGTRAAGRRWLPWGLALASLVIAVCLAGVLPDYGVFVTTSVIVSSVSLLGLGIVTGTAGMIALCQLTFGAIGAWVFEFLMLRTSLPHVLGPFAFVVLMIIGALAAAAFGVVVGLPALRLRGVNLAIITLGVAAAADLTIQQVFFPDQWTDVRVPRPFGISYGGDGDRYFLMFAAVVGVLTGLGVFFLQRSRWGATWRAVGYSERGTASAGTSVRTAKLAAFGASAFIGGLGGGLLVGQITQVNYLSFQTVNSLGLYVLSIAVGAHLIEMALLGGVIFVIVPEILKQFQISLDWASLAFAVLGVQALTTNSNFGDDARAALIRRRRRRGELNVDSDLARLTALNAPVPLGTDETLLEVSGLAVGFGAVKALDGVDLAVRKGEIRGLIGPNGAGKSTLVDALTGFLPQHSGTVRLRGVATDALVPHRIARLGLRRTFQQDRVPPSMTVGAYVRFVTRGRATDADISRALEFLGAPAASTPLQIVDVGTRRIVEVAANLAAGPEVLLLDEPAAGLSHEEHLAFADRLRAIPVEFGVTLLLIEHDLELVRSVCSSVTVLDFGKVLASGDSDEVLNDPAVVKAYMGEAELL